MNLLYSLLLTVAASHMWPTETLRLEFMHNLGSRGMSLLPDSRVSTSAFSTCRHVSLHENKHLVAINHRPAPAWQPNKKHRQYISYSCHERTSLIIFNHSS